MAPRIHESLESVWVTTVMEGLRDILTCTFWIGIVWGPCFGDEELKAGGLSHRVLQKIRCTVEQGALG